KAGLYFAHHAHYHTNKAIFGQTFFKYPEESSPKEEVQGNLSIGAPKLKKSEKRKASLANTTRGGGQHLNFKFLYCKITKAEDCHEIRIRKSFAISIMERFCPDALTFTKKPKEDHNAQKLVNDEVRIRSERGDENVLWKNTEQVRKIVIISATSI
ncbi:6811_t:CDS:2, partial [Funneliformis mosseae]